MTKKENEFMQKFCLFFIVVLFFVAVCLSVLYFNSIIEQVIIIIPVGIFTTILVLKHFE